MRAAALDGIARAGKLALPRGDFIPQLGNPLDLGRQGAKLGPQPRDGAFDQHLAAGPVKRVLAKKRETVACMALKDADRTEHACLFRAALIEVALPPLGVAAQEVDPVRDRRDRLLAMLRAVGRGDAFPPRR